MGQESLPAYKNLHDLLDHLDQVRSKFSLLINDKTVCRGGRRRNRRRRRHDCYYQVR